jgi:hypothetical protein
VAETHWTIYPWDSYTYCLFFYRILSHFQVFLLLLHHFQRVKIQLLLTYCILPKSLPRASIDCLQSLSMPLAIVLSPRIFWESIGCRSVCRSKMCHLICVCLHKRQACRSAGNIVTTGGICHQPVEPIYKAQHIRHEYVGDSP